MSKTYVVIKTNQQIKEFESSERAVEWAKKVLYTKEDNEDVKNKLERDGTFRYSYGFDEVELLLWSK